MSSATDAKTITHRTIDHPEALGRIPVAGDCQMSLRFPLEDGTTLVVECGLETYNRFEALIIKYQADRALREVGINTTP